MSRLLTNRVDTGSGSSFIGLQGLDQLQRHLRYGDARDVKFVAAAVVECYEALIRMPQKRRNEIISKIREEAGDADPIAD